MRSDWMLLCWLSAVVTAACLAVLMLRGPVRRFAGCRPAYALWMLPPLALAATLLPAPEQRVLPMTLLPSLPPVAPVPADTIQAWDVGSALCALWLAGAIASLLLQWRAQRRFVAGLGVLQAERRGHLRVWRAQSDTGLPALLGLWRPRLIVPMDFERRYDPAQRALLLRHELVHWRRGDSWANALAALLRAAQWFNSVVLHACDCFRRDQELACDAGVMAVRPRLRRRYAEAMLRACGVVHPPLACPWSAAHGLRERVRLLHGPSPGRARAALGISVVLACAGMVAGAAWATQLARPTQGARIGDHWYRTEVELDIDGQQRRFTLIERAGQWLSFSGGEGAGDWQAQLQWRPLDRQRLRLEIKLRHGGGQVTSRTMVLHAEDALARVEAADDDGHSRFAARMRATPVPPPSRHGGEDPVTARLVPPGYPPRAFAQGVGGRVVLLLDVRADGSVADVIVERSRPQGVFDAAALEAARRWYFPPVAAQGKAVARRLRVPVQFDARGPGPAARGAMQ